jgi:hypothetical protein
MIDRSKFKICILVLGSARRPRLAGAQAAAGAGSGRARRMPGPGRRAATAESMSVTAGKRSRTLIVYRGSQASRLY